MARSDIPSPFGEQQVVWGLPPGHVQITINPICGPGACGCTGRCKERADEVIAAIPWEDILPEWLHPPVPSGYRCGPQGATGPTGPQGVTGGPR